MTQRPTTITRTQIGDEHFELASDDVYLENMQGVFEPDSVELFRLLIKPIDVVLDVGANIGCTALLLSGIAKKVIAFEPSPTTFGYLKRNVEAAGRTNVEVVNAGLGRAPAKMNIVFSPDNRSGGFVSQTGLAGHTMEEIEILQGDKHLANEPRVDVIKIDVEGFEKEVISGLAETIQRHRPVVVLELNHWCLNAFQRMSVPDFLDFLRSVFPVLYAKDQHDAKDLHDTQQAYGVMHDHIVHFKYPAIVGAFSEDQVDAFLERYVRNPPPAPPPFDPMARIAVLEDERRILDSALAAERARAEAVRLEATAKLGHVEAKLLEAVQQRQALANEIEALRNSTSWRVTSPLRAVKRLVQ